MENYYSLYSGDELYHHGIKGMKWGIRRYQNKDGSLTAAGQKRRDKLQAKLDKLENKESSKNSGKTTKKISEMSDDELREYINRKNSEKMAYTLQRDISQLNPKKVSAGEKFANAIKGELSKNVAEASGKIAKELMNKAIDKAFGDKAADAMAALKKEAEKAGYQQTIANAKKAASEALKSEREANRKDDPELSAREREAKLADYDKRVSEARKAKASADYQEALARDKQKASTKDSEKSSTKTSNTSKEASAKVYNDFSNSHKNDSYSSFKNSTSSQQKAGKRFVDDIDDYYYSNLWAIGDDDY